MSEILIPKNTYQILFRKTPTKCWISSLETLNPLFLEYTFYRLQHFFRSYGDLFDLIFASYLFYEVLIFANKHLEIKA